MQAAILGNTMIIHKCSSMKISIKHIFQIHEYFHKAACVNMKIKKLHVFHKQVYRQLNWRYIHSSFNSSYSRKAGNDGVPFSTNQCNHHENTIVSSSDTISTVLLLTNDMVSWPAQVGKQTQSDTCSLTLKELSSVLMQR